MTCTTLRLLSIVLAVVGVAILAAALVSGFRYPFSLLGVLAVLVASVLSRTSKQRQELWVHGTEMLAEARRSKSWILRWTVDGRSYNAGTSQIPLLWANGRVRVLVDLDKPSRMLPLSLDMVATPETEGPSPVLPPVLAPRPRRPSLLVLTEARRLRTVALLTALLSPVVAGVVSPFVLERQRFLAEVSDVGTGQVIGRTASTVEYLFDGRRSFAANRKAQGGWPLGKTLTVYRHQGFVVAETEVPGMPLPLGVVLVSLPVVAAIGILISAVSEARLAQKLWRFGKEVSAEIISDHVLDQRREVVCRFTSAGLFGFTRREFAASRKPLEGFRGEAVVLVDPRNPRLSRMILADEA
jgi:hypothetical protein